MANLQGAGALVNDFETQWQVRHDIAAAAAAQAREQRRAAARLAAAVHHRQALPTRHSNKPKTLTG